MSGRGPQDIGRVALSILSKQPGQRMLAAALGNQLARELGVIIREATGGQKFTEFLGNCLPGQISLSGSGDQLMITLAGSLDRESEAVSKPSQNVHSYSGNENAIRRHYHRNFWLAFTASLDVSKRRYVQAAIPFVWTDIDADQPAPDGFIEIDADLIPPLDISYKERKAKTFEAIDQWCQSNAFSAEIFSHQPREIGQKTAHKSLTGAEKLLDLIKRVPEKDRVNHVLDIGFIYAILVGQ